MQSTILILISGVLWGIMGLFVKRLTILGFTSVEVSSLRWIFSAVLLLLIVGVADRGKLRVRPRDLPNIRYACAVDASLYEHEPNVDRGRGRPHVHLADMGADRLGAAFRRKA